VLCENFEDVFVKEDYDEVGIESKKEVGGNKPENRKKVMTNIS